MVVTEFKCCLKYLLSGQERIRILIFFNRARLVVDWLVSFKSCLVYFFL